MKKLKKIQELNLKLPKSNVGNIIDNPKKWAERTAEQFLKENITGINKALNLGETFAKSLERDTDD